MPNLPQEAIQNAVGIGLQRNYISKISTDFINSFNKLEVLDVRSQHTPHRCVELVGGPIYRDVKILGNYDFYYYHSFLLEGVVFSPKEHYLTLIKHDLNSCHFHRN